MASPNIFFHRTHGFHLFFNSFYYINLNYVIVLISRERLNPLRQIDMQKIERCYCYVSIENNKLENVRCMETKSLISKEPRILWRQARSNRGPLECHGLRRWTE